jgi:FixJ family two-component response regulator
MSLKFPAPSRPAFLSPEETPMNLQTTHPAVLIIDDDPDVLTALYDLIEHDGIRLTDVSTCLDALAQVKTVDFAEFCSILDYPMEMG